MKIFYKKIFYQTALVSIFLSIFSYSIASYIHLNSCHDEICQESENCGYGHVIKINNQNLFHECQICHFLHNNFLNFALTIFGIFLIYSTFKLLNHQNHIPNIILFQNLARAPPHF